MSNLLLISLKLKLLLAKEFGQVLNPNIKKPHQFHKVTAGLPTVGVRVPRNLIAISLLKIGGPIAASIVNKSVK